MHQIHSGQPKWDTKTTVDGTTIRGQLKEDRMKVKVFYEENSVKIQDLVNEWLEKNSGFQILQIHPIVSRAQGGSGLYMTIVYSEDPNNTFSKLTDR